ncbi:UDP-N-acetylglucosamine transporter, partial [Fragariocoptes setiger]
MVITRSAAHRFSSGGEQPILTPKLPRDSSPKPRKPKPETSVHKYIRWTSLIVLTLQTTSIIILFSYSRASPTGDTLYLSSTVVVVAEIFKLAVCALIVSYEHGIGAIFREFVNRPLECCKILLPASLYAIQNNLAFYALKNLDAATYQVAYQLKILTTAMFSVIMVNKKLKQIQWLALVSLFVGVSLVQLPSDSHQVNQDHRNKFLGLIAVVACCLSSGFSGVYFESLIKLNPVYSVWMRNLQMALFCLFISSITMFYTDAEKIAEGGLFQGYDILTWIIVFLQAFGGLLVATVVKFADNILKGFATSISIIMSTVLSFLLFDHFNPPWNFYCGAFIVIISTIMYSL